MLVQAIAGLALFLGVIVGFLNLRHNVRSHNAIMDSNNATLEESPSGSRKRTRDPRAAVAISEYMDINR